MVDSVPKVTMLLSVNALVEFIKDDLFSAVFDDNPQEADRLLEESAELVTERRELLEVYEASKTALKVITQVDMRTRADPIPPMPATQVQVAAQPPVAPRKSPPQRRPVPSHPKPVRQVPTGDDTKPDRPTRRPSP